MPTATTGATGMTGTTGRTEPEPGAVRREQGTERTVLYGDFTCPASYLASRRVDRLLELGRPAPDWRAVQHRPSLPLTGLRLAGGARATRTAEVGRVRAALSEGEDLPISVPTVLPHAAAAALVHAEAYRAGVADLVRPAIFHAYWVEGRDIGDVDVLRDLVGAVLGPRRISDAAVEQAAAWQEEWLGLGGGIALTWASHTRTLVGRPALRRVAPIEPQQPGTHVPAA